MAENGEVTTQVMSSNGLGGIEEITQSENLIQGFLTVYDKSDNRNSTDTSKFRILFYSFAIQKYVWCESNYTALRRTVCHAAVVRCDVYTVNVGIRKAGVHCG